MNVNDLNVAEPSVRFRPAADVRPGYKLTEIGIIPADWHILSLGEISSFRTGPFGSALHKSDYIEGGIPLINPMHIVDGEIKPAASTTVTPHAARRLAAYRFRRKDIVIGRRGDMGRCAVIGEVEVGWLCGTGSLIIRSNGSVDASFIQRTLTTERVIRAIEDASVGSTMVNLNQRSLSRLQIQCPPIIEQRKIAEGLSDVDELLKALEALLAKKRAIKQGAMQQLLSGKTRLPGFHGKWTKTNLGAIGECFIGLTYRPENVVEHGLLVLRASNIHNGRLIYDDNVYVHLAVPDQLITRTGDILICVRNGSRALIGKSAVIGDDAVGLTFGAFMCVYRTKQWRFVAHAFQGHHIQRQIRDNIGATINQITNKDMKALRIKLPCEDEQIAIADVLSNMDIDIATLEARRDKTRAIKQGMMQQLLTGRIRLVKPQPAEASA